MASKLEYYGAIAVPISAILIQAALLIPVVELDFERCSVQGKVCTFSEGPVLVGPFEVQFTDTPVGGYATCDGRPSSTSNQLVWPETDSAKAGCNAIQLGAPISLGVLFLSLLFVDYRPVSVPATILFWISCMALVGIGIFTLVAFYGDELDGWNRPDNVDAISLHFGGYLLCFSIAIMMIGMISIITGKIFYPTPSKFNAYTPVKL